MEKIITLEELSEIQNLIGQGVRVVFCSSEDNDFVILGMKDFISFKAIKEEITDRCRYKVFRIDSSNDIICVYVVTIE